MKPAQIAELLLPELTRLWGAAPPSDLSVEPLRSSVWRLRRHGAGCSVIAKRLSLQRACIEQQALQRWLPRLEMAGNGVELLGAAAEPGCARVWHLYEDFGDWRLDRPGGDAARVEAAVEVLARLHSRAAGHGLLAEARLAGRELGAGFYLSSARDAARCLAGIPPPVLREGNRRELVAALARRVSRMASEAAERTAFLEAHGGPETLLHGDIGADNAFVLPGPRGFRVHFIDWDHAGVGPAAYDLSNFLAGCGPALRSRLVDKYRESAARKAWRPGDPAVVNGLFETLELARLANSVVWAALGAQGDSPEWAFEELARIEGWFETRQPLLEAA